MGVLTGWTQGFYTKDRPSNKIDVAVVEATEIKEDGSIVPGASVGATPELLQLADKVGRPRLLTPRWVVVVVGGGTSLTAAPDHHRGQHLAPQL